MNVGDIFPARPAVKSRAWSQLGKGRARGIVAADAVRPHPSRPRRRMGTCPDLTTTFPATALKPPPITRISQMEERILRFCAIGEICGKKQAVTFVRGLPATACAASFPAQPAGAGTAVRLDSWPWPGRRNPPGITPKPSAFGEERARQRCGSGSSPVPLAAASAVAGGRGAFC